MTDQKRRGGAGRGQGRKALAGEVRKVRPFKASNAEWEDFKLVTPERVRQWVAKEAAKLRRAEKPNLSLSLGDNLTFISRSIEITADAGLIKVLTRNAAVLIRTFDEFMAEHPDATAQQIWDEAFVAGHETAYTLLQGEIPSE